MTMRILAVCGLLAGAAAVGLLSPAAGSGSASGAGLAKDLTLDVGNGVTMKLVLIPAGKFTMDSKDTDPDTGTVTGTPHEVTISKPFYLGETEVTQGVYEAVMGANPSRFKGPTHPVGKVSWNDATDFCRRLSEKTGQAGRLPTEAEWEYACRARTKTRFPFGNSDEALGDYAWYMANSGNTTHPVRQKKPNAWGLYDMLGNVWEWCSDWHGDYPKTPVKDPQGPPAGVYRVFRGGCFNNPSVSCRAAFRGGSQPEHSGDGGFGIRVAVSAPNP